MRGMDRKTTDEATMKFVTVHLKTQSQPIEYQNVLNAYQKGSFYCIYLPGGVVDKYPIRDIFRVKEDYGPHKNNLPDR